jgi:hypothetical protein
MTPVNNEGMARFTWLLLIATVMIGCEQTKSALTPAARIKVSIRSMDLVQKKQLITFPGLKSTGNELLVMAEPNALGYTLYQSLMENNIGFDETYLENPNRLVVVVRRGPYGRILTEEDKQLVRRLAGEVKGTVQTDLLVKRVLGPDGKTPMVLKNKTMYSGGGSDKLTDHAVVLSFPTVAKAKEAAKYFDSRVYKVEVTPDAGRGSLRATWRGQAGQSSDSYEMVAPVAKAFGGRFEYGETSGDM